MRNVQEKIYGNDYTSLEFISKKGSGEINFANGSFGIPHPISLGNPTKGYTKFEEDGTSVANGDAVCWDDLRFPASQTKTGSNLKPDFDEVNLGLLFPQNNPLEKIYIISIMPHEYKLGTNLKPHIHFIQNSVDLPTFKMEYRWYNNGSVPPASFTTLTSGDPVFEYPGSGDFLQIVSFPDILDNDLHEVAAVIDIVIYRDDNVVVGDVLMKEFDIHYQIDMLGSRYEFTK